MVSTQDQSTHSSTVAEYIAESATAQQTIHIVLPAYNEAEALPPLLCAIHAALDKSDVEYSIIVVDDGSRDDTALVASQASFHMPVVLVKHGVNQGLAAAIRTGFRAAIAQANQDDVIFLMDADNTHPPALVHRMLGMIREGHDVVIASRYQPGARVVGVPWHRNLLSLGARGLFRLMFPIKGVRDYTCGYRAYKEEVLRRAMADYGDDFVSEKGFSCMVDVLLKLRRYDLIMGEVPLILRYDQKGGVSKMNVARTIWQTLALLFRRRFTRTSST